MTINVPEIKKRLFSFLNDTNLVNEYIRIYGPSINIKYIKTIKEKKSQSIPVDEETGGNDPVFEIKLKCPVCNRDDITCYALRAKSQQITFNKFIVPSYKGASGYKTVDYSMIYTTVCPRCLFASPDKKDFIRIGDTAKANNKSQLSSNVKLNLMKQYYSVNPVAQSIIYSI